MLSTKPRLVL